VQGTETRPPGTIEIPESFSLIFHGTQVNWKQPLTFLKPSNDSNLGKNTRKDTAQPQRPLNHKATTESIVTSADVSSCFL